MESLQIAPLKKKQSSTQEEWETSWSFIQANPDQERAHRLVEQAVERTLKRVGGTGAVGWGFSGGKDSLGLQVVMEVAGLDSLPSCGGLTRLEFPEFDKWMETPDNVPSNFSILRLENINLEWLTGRPELLFPTQNAGRWFPLVQKAAQNKFAKAFGLEILVGGWRKHDGNYLGTANQMYEYRTPQGHVRFSPISQWTHEDLLHVLAVYRKSLPPIYGYPRGFPIGTGPWPSRKRLESLEASWRELESIDSSIVVHAAERGFLPAIEYLNRS